MKVSFRRNGPAVPAVEVIHYRNLMPGCEKLMGGMGTDITGATSNQHGRGFGIHESFSLGKTSRLYRPVTDPVFQAGPTATQSHDRAPGFQDTVCGLRDILLQNRVGREAAGQLLSLIHI